ncbi:hypothetical protein D3C71_1643480 [compost metagenome]
MRASASTQIFGAMAATALDAANSTSTPRNMRLRSTWARRAVSGGPNSITTTANSVTSWPALATEIDRSLASAGSRPTMRNSVVTITKAAIARISVDRRPVAAAGRPAAVEEEDMEAGRKAANP